MVLKGSLILKVKDLPVRTLRNTLRIVEMLALL